MPSPWWYQSERQRAVNDGDLQRALDLAEEEIQELKRELIEARNEANKDQTNWDEGWHQGWHDCMEDMRERQDQNLAGKVL